MPCRPVCDLGAASRRRIRQRSDRQNRTFAGNSSSPLTDSNRRPPPYHEREEGADSCGFPRNDAAWRSSLVAGDRRVLQCRATLVRPRLADGLMRSHGSWSRDGRHGDGHREPPKMLKPRPGGGAISSRTSSTVMIPIGRSSLSRTGTMVRFVVGHGADDVVEVRVRSDAAAVADQVGDRGVGFGADEVG